MPDKGIDTLLQASEMLPHLKFTIIGGHPSEIESYKKKWENLNLENVNFLGFKNPKFIPKYLKMSDLLILPSTAKTKKSSLYTSAMKLFEYLGAGKAIIASDIPSVREVLKHAVKRMLPGGPLAKKQLTKLKIYSGSNHPHEAQNPESIDLKTLNKKIIVKI